jgi:hypothetical protein
MAVWFSRDSHDSDDVDDETGVGLIDPESKHSSGQRQSRVSNFSLGVALVLSNIVWAGICLVLWRELRGSSDSARIGFDKLEADFGTSSPKSNYISR